jgi:two-component system, cell cycle response regulator
VPDRPKILVVDDEPTNLELLERMLRRKYIVRTAVSGTDALEVLKKEKFAAILSDQRMPGMTGTQFLAEARKLVPDTVRMILTGYAAEPESLEAINLAHVANFLTKPVSIDAVERAVADAVEVYELSLKNHDLIQELANKNNELSEAKRLLEMSLDERTRELYEANRRLESQALRDSLTGLFNHRFFQERLAEETERQKRYGGPLSLVLADVDHFRVYNETLGHPEGDKLLRTIARILSGTTRSDEVVARIRPTDMVARFAGGQFAVIVPETSKRGAAAMCERVRATVDRAEIPVSDALPLKRVTLSFGVAEYPLDADNKVKLIESAELALARAKTDGRDRVVTA